MVVLSGDLELYSMLIRKKQWENLGDKLLRHDGKFEFPKLVSKLEEQYLLKILKPDYRIKMENLKYYTDNLSVYVRHPEGRTVDLRNILDTLCGETFFLKSSADIGRYREYFLGLPVRTIIQLLAAFSRVDKQWMHAGCNADDNFPVPDADVVQFLDSVADIFQRSLLDYNYTFEDVKAIKNLACINKLAVDHELSDCLETVHKLNLENRDDPENPFRIVLGAHYARYMKTRPASYFAYIIKVGLIREIAKNKYGTQRDHFIRFAGLDMNDKAIEVSRKFTAFFRGDKTWDVGCIHTGTVKLCPESLNEDERENWNKYEVKIDPSSKYLIDFYKNMKLESTETDSALIKYCNTLGSLEKAIGSWHGVFMNILFSINISEKGDAKPYASIFNLLGLISILLETDNENDMDRMLVEYSRLFLYYEDQEGERAEQRGDTLRRIQSEYGGLIKEHKKETNYTEFNKLILEWMKKATQLPCIPVYIVARIRIRFFYTLTQMNHGIKEEDWYLGNLIHRLIVGFLNAVLVESALFHEIDIQGIDLRNPVTSDDVFMKNVEWMGEQPEEIQSFFAFFFSCPIWGLFLNPEEGRNRIFPNYAAHLSNYLNKKNFKPKYKNLLKVSYERKSEDFILDSRHPIRQVIGQIKPEIRVFINCTEEDQEIANHLYDDLLIHGLIPWMEDRNIMPGQRINIEIKKAIHSCDYFIPLFSKTTIAKQGDFRKKLKMAWDVKMQMPDDEIFIIPVRIEDCLIDDEIIQGINYVDLFESYEKGLERIIQLFDYIKKEFEGRITDSEHIQDQSLAYGNLYAPLNSVLLQKKYRRRRPTGIGEIQWR